MANNLISCNPSTGSGTASVNVTSQQNPQDIDVNTIIKCKGSNLTKSVNYVTGHYIAAPLIMQCSTLFKSGVSINNVSNPEATLQFIDLDNNKVLYTLNTINKDSTLFVLAAPDYTYMYNIPLKHNGNYSLKFISNKALNDYYGSHSDVKFRLEFSLSKKDYVGGLSLAFPKHTITIGTTGQNINFSDSDISVVGKDNIRLDTTCDKVFGNPYGVLTTQRLILPCGKKIYLTIKLNGNS